MNAKEFKVSKLTIQALKDVPTEAVEWSEKENASPSAEKAPYTLVPIRGENWTIDDLAKATSAATNCSIEEARYTWSAAMLLIGEILSSGLYTSIDVGFWKFVLKVAGSIPNANAECDPTVNYPYIACYACRDLQVIAAGLETVQDVSNLPFVVKEVMEQTDAKKTNLGKVTAGRYAAINGLRLTMGDADEKIELLKDGVAYPLAYEASRSKLNTQLSAVVPKSVPVGKGYTLRVTAYGQGAYEGETLKPGAIVVPYDKPNIEVEEDKNPLPEVTVDEAFGELDGDKVVGELNGENLKMVEGDTLSFSVTHGGTTEQGEANVVENTDGKIAYEIEGASAEWAGGQLTLTLKSRAGDPTLPFQTVEKTFDVA